MPAYSVGNRNEDSEFWLPLEVACQDTKIEYTRESERILQWWFSGPEQLVGLKVAPICGLAKPWGVKALEDKVQRNNLVFDTVRREHLSSRSETNGVFSPVLSALSLTPHLCSSKCVMGLTPAIHPPTDTARGSSQSDISLWESQISWSRAQSRKTAHFRCCLRSQFVLLTQWFELRVPMIPSSSLVIC